MSIFKVNFHQGFKDVGKMSHYVESRWRAANGVPRGDLSKWTNVDRLAGEIRSAAPDISRAHARSIAISARNLQMRNFRT